MPRAKNSADELVMRLNRGEFAEVLASEQGIKVPALYQRFRRAGYHWDICRNQYVKGDRTFEANPQSDTLPERAIQVIVRSRGVKTDRELVRMLLAFKSIREMDDYMREFGFEWYAQGHIYRVIRQ